MTKRATETTEKRPKEQRVLPEVKAWFKLFYRRGFVGVLLLALAVITLLGLADRSGGFLVDWWSRLLLQVFGWGSYVVALLLAAAGSLLLVLKIPDPKTVPWHIVIGAEVVFLALLGLTHLFLSGSEPWEAARAGEGGGYIGAALSGTLTTVLGPVGAGLIIGVVLIWGAIIVSGMTFEQWAEQIEEWGEQAWQKALATYRGLFPPQPVVEPQVPVIVRPEPPPKVKHRHRFRIRLPPLELLDPPEEADSDESDLSETARMIEETLDHFGVPATVVEVNRGPMVTQFGVEPGYVSRRGYDGEETERKIRVAKIASLSDDLALALAAAPIRVEAPVPGRSIVGIEVPNSQVTRVSLRGAMSSSAFRRYKSGYALALGEGVSGAPVAADLTRMPHLLIAGATGSGKSVCIHAIAAALLLQNSPFTLRVVMIDPKRVELYRYNGLPHLYGQVESDAERVVDVLGWLVHEMQERYKRLEETGARHVNDYNRHWRLGSREYLPRIVVLIDELADLMLFSPEEVERSICRLAQMARATGIHLVIATQRPSVDIVTGLIKANFPARIGFAVSSGVDSRVILDAVGAETLLSKGDMLYMAPDAAGLVRAQGCFVSDDELERVVRYWQAWAVAEGWEQEPAPWETGVTQADELESDDLLDQAIEIVREHGSASASLLQRRMRIGYPRASRLIDEMEELGIVGPPESGGKARQVLDYGLDASQQA